MKRILLIEKKELSLKTVQEIQDGLGEKIKATVIYKLEDAEKFSDFSAFQMVAVNAKFFSGPKLALLVNRVISLGHENAVVHYPGDPSIIVDFLLLED